MSTVRRTRGGIRPRRFSKAEYYRLGELGFFRGQRVELIEGRLMVSSPQNPAHGSAVCRVGYALQQAFGTGYLVRTQLPLDLGQATEPEPDVAVVVGPFSLYDQAHPTAAMLVVEVSDATLNYDRRQKGSLYARGGVTDYWIVNLPDRRLEVYRQPIADRRAVRPPLRQSRRRAAWRYSQPAGRANRNHRRR
ncbi:MAG: Uma2 family endonuclease [Gemmataceae bacterium]